MIKYTDKRKMCINSSCLVAGHICIQKKKKQGKQNHAPHPIEAIKLGFATYCSTNGYKRDIPAASKILISNQQKFNKRCECLEGQDRDETRYAFVY
jgi:hypothetical protein